MNDNNNNNNSDKRKYFEAEEMMRGLSDAHAELVKSFVGKLKGAAAGPDQGDIKLELWCLPAEVRSAVEAFDFDATGQVSAADLQEAASMLHATRHDSEIKIAHLPVHTRQFLECFDADGDGTLSTPELAEGARLYRESKFALKRALKILAVVVLFFCVLVAAIGGVTAAVVEATKVRREGGGGGERGWTQALVNLRRPSTCQLCKAMRSCILDDAHKCSKQRGG